MDGFLFARMVKLWYCPTGMKGGRMSGLFYKLGRMVGPKVRKANWVWQSITARKADSIRAEYAVGLDLAGKVLHK